MGPCWPCIQGTPPQASEPRPRCPQRSARSTETQVPGTNLMNSLSRNLSPNLLPSVHLRFSVQEFLSQSPMYSVLCSLTSENRDPRPGISVTIFCASLSRNFGPGLLWVSVLWGGMISITRRSVLWGTHISQLGSLGSHVSVLWSLGRDDLTSRFSGLCGGRSKTAAGAQINIQIFITSLKFEFIWKVGVYTID